MEFQSGHTMREQAIRELFTATFSASEGAEEGKAIGGLVHDLMETTPTKDLFVWSAYDDQELVGCIFLSRLTFAQEDRAVFILSPVAVKTDRQNSGIGQKLIAYGLDDMRKRGIDVVITYGDPNYYSRTGFKQITQKFARAPFELSIPAGWLGISLRSGDDRPLRGSSRCVPALQNPEFW